MHRCLSTGRLGERRQWQFLPLAGDSNKRRGGESCLACSPDRVLAAVPSRAERAECMSLFSPCMNTGLTPDLFQFLRGLKMLCSPRENPHSSPSQRSAKPGLLVPAQELPTTPGHRERTPSVLGSWPRAGSVPPVCLFQRRLELHIK